MTINQQLQWFTHYADSDNVRYEEIREMKKKIEPLEKKNDQLIVYYIFHDCYILILTCPTPPNIISYKHIIFILLCSIFHSRRLELSYGTLLSMKNKANLQYIIYNRMQYLFHRFVLWNWNRLNAYSNMISKPN